MNFTTVINYSALTRRQTPRGQPEKAHFHEEVELSVEAVTDDQAPVATRWKDGETRWYDGRHYLAWFDVDAVSSDHPARDAARAVSEIADHQRVTGVTEGYLDLGFGTRSSSFQGDADIFHDGHERRAALDRAALWCRNALSVDGRLWMACAEPVYRLATDEPWNDEVVKDILTFNSSLAGCPNHRRVQKFFCNDLHTAHHEAGVSDSLRIEVLLPDSLTRDTAREALLRSAQFLFDDYSYKPLEAVHPEIFQHLSLMKPLLWRKPDEAVDCDRLSISLSYCLDAVEEHETVERISAPSNLAGFRRGVERWTDRPVAIADIGRAPRR